MLSFSTQKKLADLIQVIGNGERQIENIRQRIAEVYAFEPYTVFRRIDRFNHNYLSTSDLTSFMNSNEQFPIYSDIRLIFNQLDRNKDNRISYEEFQYYLLPHFNSSLKYIAQNRQSYYCAPDEFLIYDIEILIVDLFNQIIQNQKQYELFRQDLISSYDFNIRDAFDLVDLNRINFADSGSIAYFVKSRNNIMSYLEQDSFLDYADLDQDGSISFREFCDLILQQQQPASIYESPKKSIIKSPLKSGYISPTKKSVYTSPIKATASALQKSRIIESIPISYSPGGNKVNEQHCKDNIQKIEDNQTYQNYLNNSRAFSIEKNLEKSSQSFYSPSRHYRNRSQLDINYSPSRTLKKSGIAFQKEYPINIEETDYRLKRKAQMKQSCQSPIKNIEEDQLVVFLRKHIQFNREIENSKKQLSYRQDFCLMDAFRLFDVNQNSRISKFELENGLNKLGVFPKQNDILLFMKAFDQDNKGFINFGDFSKICHSSDQSLVNLMSSRIPQYVEPKIGENQWNVLMHLNRFGVMKPKDYSGYYLPKSLMLKIIWINLEWYFKTGQTLIFMMLLIAWYLLKLNFVQIIYQDIDNNGFISYEELKAMLESHGIYTSSDDLISLFKKFDKCQLGKISYGEFTEELRPKSPTRKRIF